MPKQGITLQVGWSCSVSDYVNVYTSMPSPMIGNVQIQLEFFVLIVVKERPHLLPISTDLSCCLFTVRTSRTMPPLSNIIQSFLKRESHRGGISCFSVEKWTVHENCGCGRHSFLGVSTKGPVGAETMHLAEIRIHPPCSLLYVRTIEPSQVHSSKRTKESLNSSICLK